jgi:hypothetical protein
MPWSKLTGLGDESTERYPIWEAVRSDPPEVCRPLAECTHGWFHEADGRSVTYVGWTLGAIIRDVFNRFEREDVHHAWHAHVGTPLLTVHAQPLADDAHRYRAQAGRDIVAFGYTALEAAGFVARQFKTAHPELVKLPDGDDLLALLAKVSVVEPADAKRRRLQFDASVRLHLPTVERPPWAERMAGLLLADGWNKAKLHSSGVLEVWAGGRQ